MTRILSWPLADILQLMGGPDNLQQALAIFTRLRTWHAGGRMNTPCNDKDIELTLGRHLQLMGEQTIWKRPWRSLPGCAPGMREDGCNTPCNDKEIELTLGRHLQLMGGADNMDKALAIFTRLRARAAGGRSTPPVMTRILS